MNKEQITELILEDRGKFYGCNRETFFSDGTTFKHRESLDGKNTLYVTKLFNHVFITTGREIIKKLSHLSKENLDTERLKILLPEFQIEMTYPHFFYRVDQIDRVPLTENYFIKAADPAYHPPLQEFLDGCTEEDIEDALIDLEDPDEEIRLVYWQNKPIGYAGYRRWGVNMGDVGILIQKEHRRKGLGRAAVAEATKACLDNNCLPFYRTSSDNQGSETIARSLGYTFEWMTTECNCTL